MSDYLCPKCGKKAMIKQKTAGKYNLVCQVCGFKRGTLPKDRKSGVV